MVQHPQPRKKNMTSQSKSFKPFKLFFSFAFASSLLCSPALAAKQVGVLEGHVDKADSFRQPVGPSLKRNANIKPGDSFGGSPSSATTETFDAPAAMFDSNQPAIPRPPFNLHTEDEGNADMNGLPGTPAFGQMPMNSGMPMGGSMPMEDPLLARQNGLPPVAMRNPADPDETAEMQLAWDEWHRRVAEAIFIRFDGLAQKAFANSRPLNCQVVYTVRRDHQITNIRMVQNSPNMMYNAMILMVIKSMNGNPILEFPGGSRRMMVEKLGNFTRNCGDQGFKFTINDRERIRQH